MSNRETARDRLQSILQTGLGANVQAVYGYYIGDFKGKTSIVIVTSAGSQRPRFTMRGRKAQFKFNIVIYVLYSKSGQWTEAQAEDRLDLLEKSIYDVLDTYTCDPGYWIALEVANENGYSAMDYVIIGGLEYKRETITINVEV